MGIDSKRVSRTLILSIDLREALQQLLGTTWHSSRTSVPEFVYTHTYIYMYMYIYIYMIHMCMYIQIHTRGSFIVVACWCSVLQAISRRYSRNSTHIICI